MKSAAQGRELEGPEGIYNPTTQRDPDCRLCQEDKFHTVHTSSAATSSPAVRHALDRADLALQEVSRWTTHMPGVPLNEKVASLVNEAWEAVYAANTEIRKAER